MHALSAPQLFDGSADHVSSLEILCHSATERDFWPFYEFMLSLQIPRTFLFFIKNENRWIGIALGRILGDCSELFFISVEPEFRRCGIGKILLDAFVRHSSLAYNMGRMLLEVRESNRPAICLYEAHGFMKIGKRKKYYDDGEDALIYELSLQSLD